MKTLKIASCLLTFAIMASCQAMDGKTITVTHGAQGTTLGLGFSK